MNDFQIGVLVRNYKMASEVGWLKIGGKLGGVKEKWWGWMSSRPVFEKVESEPNHHVFLAGFALCYEEG
jgi:hypothetical protein